MSETDPVVAGPDSPVAVSAAAKTQVKRRRPLERALVWTLIAVLAVLASAETWSRYSFQQAYDHLGNRLEVGDERSVECLDAADVKAYLGDRKPSRTEDYIAARKFIVNGATHLEVYSWFTLNPVHRRDMFVYYDAYGPARKAQWQVLSIQAEEEKYVPLLSPGEQKIMDQLGPDGTWQDFKRLSGFSDSQVKLGPGPRGGRGGRRRSQPPTEVNQPDPGSQPQADPTRL